jgi:hypothetical protein
VVDDVPGVGCQSNYHYSIWADTLAEFFGFKNSRDLRFWAENNPKLWGNKYGGDMFVFDIAFIDDTKAYIDDLEIKPA